MIRHEPVVYRAGAKVLRLRKVPVEQILLRRVHETECWYAPELQKTTVLHTIEQS